MKSMRGMQEIQPKVKYLQEKYKNDLKNARKGYAVISRTWS